MRITMFAVSALLGCVLPAAPIELGMNMHGGVRVGDTGASFCLKIHHPGWTGVSSGLRKNFDFSGLASDSAEFGFFKDGVKCATGSTTLTPADGGGALLKASVTSVVDQRTEAVVLSLTMPAARFAGTVWKTSAGKHGTLQAEWDGSTVGLHHGKAEWIEFALGSGTSFRFAFPKPTEILLQDDRKWAQTFTLRVCSGGRAFNRGERRDFTCTISSPDGTSITVDKPIEVKAGAEWIPLDYRKDILPGSALDFSNQGFHDAPAGKYGWLRNAGGHFEFEKRPGERQRFYGVNLCFDASFPDHEFAECLADRIARLGYNAVRIHHYESPRGVVKRGGNGLALDAGRMDRIDFLLAKFYERGIYVTTDLFTSRSVTWRACGIDRDGSVPMQVYKNLLLVHEPALENWKAFSRNLLSHVNGYTGRAWKDEPALPLISLVNEGHLTWCWGALRGEDFLKRDWVAWLAERRAADPSFGSGCDDPEKVKNPRDALVIAYMAHIERRGVGRMRAFLRELGVRALLTNQNCGGHYAPLMEVREELYDYVDDHFYVDHPQFLVRSWSLPSKCGNGNPVLSSSLPPVHCAFTRMPTKPFCITEWNFSGPGMFRGVGGIMTGAMGALQDWDGLWRFAYSHGLENMRDRYGHPGYFDVSSDPLGQAGDRASLCLFLRGDLEPLAGALANRVEPGDLCPKSGRPVGVVPPWKDAAWSVRTATAVAEVPGWDIFPLARQLEEKTCPVTFAQNKAVRLDRERGTFSIVTPKTAGGFTPAGVLDAGTVAFDAGDTATTLWASSLDGLPISASRRILVSHLTDVQADGNVYADKAKTILLKWGHYPPLVRNGKARVKLALANPAACTVWALETSGRRLEMIPATVENGKLVFTAAVKGPQGARMLYEVAAKQ